MIGKPIAVLGAAASVPLPSLRLKAGTQSKAVMTVGVWLYWEPLGSRVPGFEDALDVEATDLTIAVMLACRMERRRLLRAGLLRCTRIVLQPAVLVVGHGPGVARTPVR